MLGKYQQHNLFCIVTFKPRETNKFPKEEAVRPLPRDDATPPVTKICLMVPAGNLTPVATIGAKLKT